MVQGSQSIVCPNCGNPNTVGASFCLKCGSSLSPGMVTGAGTVSPGFPQYAVAPKARSTALLLEILLSLAGLLGIGWIYAGQTSTGVLILVGYLVWNFIALAIDIVTLGIFVCLHVPINIALIAVSAMLLHSHTKQHPELFGV